MCNCDWDCDDYGEEIAKIFKEWGMDDETDNMPVGSLIALFLNFISSNTMLFFSILKVVSAENGHYLPEFRIGLFVFLGMWHIAHLVHVVIIPL